IKTYRESKLNPMGIEVVEPLWNKTAEEVIEEFLNSGIKSKIIVTQADKLDRSFIGKDLNRSTINLFPDDVDVCGENGEYHTLSYAGGPFKNTVDFSILRIVKETYNIKLDDGNINTYEYWQAEIDH
ncbi:MAG: ATP-binding protein, partial [Flavobacterium sp.]